MSGDLESFGDSSGDADQLALTKVADLLHELGTGAMVQRFVLIVEAADEDDRNIYGYVAPQQKRWDTMGLLQWAMTMEQNVFLDEIDEIDDEQ